MDRNEIVRKLRAFVKENYLYMRPDYELDNDALLMDEGIIDSMGVAEVIYFLEEEFGIIVADEDVTEENLGTISAIAGYIEREDAAKRTA